MRPKLKLEYIGEAKYLILLHTKYNNEPEEFHLIKMSDDDADAEGEVHNGKRYGMKGTYFHVDRYERKFKLRTTVEVYKRKDNWRTLLLNAIEEYENLQDVDLQKALLSCYDMVNHGSRRPEFRFSINGDKSHLMDMCEFMMKIMFPISDVKGDVSYFYKYKDRYIVIREFMYNKIYIIDALDEDTQERLFTKIRIECKICNLKTKLVGTGSKMQDISTASDEERIKILLDPKSPPELREKAKGNVR